jgi:hypothetical protein
MADRNAPSSSDGEPLPADVAAELAGWATSEPPAGFVDRVVAAARGPTAPRAALRRRPLAAVIAAVLGVAASLVLLRGSPGSPDEGARVVVRRETLALGRRGVAVAEAGTELTWAISASGAAEVHQSRGDAFYRVEPGGPFAVETPHGRILVTGTCFRVEILDMTASRPTWSGGVVGAALAPTVVISVYEGRVRVVNARGQADARAGDRIALGAGAGPARLDPGAAPPAAAALETPPPESATVAELRQRDQSHRGEIALLRARVHGLETGAAAPEPAAPPDHRAGQRKIIDIPPDELAAMARSCEIRFDVPGYGIEPRLMTDRAAAAFHLSADERAIYDQAVRAQNPQYMAALRALYQELVGGDSENLDAPALVVEIMQKSPSSDVQAARKRLAEERGGLAAPPADPRNRSVNRSVDRSVDRSADRSVDRSVDRSADRSADRSVDRCVDRSVDRSVIERLFRLESAAGTALEQRLATELGADRAHQIRAAGWVGGDDSILYGCPD